MDYEATDKAHTPSISYQLGGRAAKSGKAIGDCPYIAVVDIPIITLLRNEWRCGFLAARNTVTKGT